MAARDFDGRAMAMLARAMAALVPVLALALLCRSGKRARVVDGAYLGSRRATRERLRRVERLAGIGEYVWNVDTGAVWWSENCYRLYGLDPGEPMDIDRALDALHPDDAALARASTAAILAGALPVEVPLRVVRPDGSVRHMLSSGELHARDGERVVFGYMKDITDLAEARERLEQARGQYRFLFEHNPVPMWVCDSRRLTLLAVNDAMLRHYGYGRDELLGRSVRVLFAPEDAHSAGPVACNAAPEQPQGRVWTHLRHDGGRMRMALYTHAIRFEDHDACLVAAQDVTERELNEERFRLIARAATDAVFELDLLHGRLWWNESLYALFGHAPGVSSIGRRAWIALVHPDDAECVLAGFDQALASRGDEWRDEYRFRHADGHYVQVAARALIQRDHEGRAVRMVGGMTDVTEARAQEGRLRLLERAVESTDNGILIADARAPDHPLVYANPAFERMTGYAAEEVAGRNCRFLQNGDRAQAGIEDIRHAIAESREVRALLRNYRKDGSPFWNEMYIAPVRDEQGVLTHYVGVLNDVSERHRFEEHLAHRATHDELTGLPNRVLLEDRLRQAMHTADRSGLRAVVVFIDLDDFKLVNDSLGHGMGDELLREVALRLSSVVRDTDTVSRFGGDEFVAVLASADPDERPGQIVARLVAALERPIQLGDVAHALTASIGYCTYPGDGRDPYTLLRHADQAMYVAKRRGRNRAVAYRSEFDRTVSRRLRLVAQLRQALERDEFELVFQPQADADGRICALEALVRWRHPVRGLLLPADFIDACEDSGLMVELGRRVLRDAVRCRRRLVEAGRGDVRIAVNVSAAQFNDDLYDEVASALDGATLEPGALDLELTESVLMESPAQAAALMDRLAQLGVGFSVDDFGTGYSSLAYLKRFPIDRLKIDRSFVQDLGAEPSDSICQSIISLAHALELETVAEGVESEAQCAWLRGHGCELLQGYLVGRPETFDALLPRLVEAS